MLVYVYVGERSHCGYVSVGMWFPVANCLMWKQLPGAIFALLAFPSVHLNRELQGAELVGMCYKLSVKSWKMIDEVAVTELFISWFLFNTQEQFIIL